MLRWRCRVEVQPFQFLVVFFFCQVRLDACLPAGLDACRLLASMLACLLASMPAACWPRCLPPAGLDACLPVGLDACRLLASMSAACWSRCLPPAGLDACLWRVWSNGIIRRDFFCLISFLYIVFLFFGFLVEVLLFRC
ncbi:hypothetical protein [Thiolapillus sp.]|uniref:hypothetical protein n=1 Tax=Thiolapillus sp. TaxID=2017437 RepID=UPI003AF532E1